jgi:hypothetical protein
LFSFRVSEEAEAVDEEVDEEVLVQVDEVVAVVVVVAEAALGSECTVFWWVLALALEV